MTPHGIRPFGSRLALKMFMQEIRAQDTGKVDEHANKVYYSKSTKYYMVIETGMTDYKVYFYRKCPC